MKTGLVLVFVALLAPGLLGLPLQSDSLLKRMARDANEGKEEPTVRTVSILYLYIQVKQEPICISDLCRPLVAISMIVDEERFPIFFPIVSVTLTFCVCPNYLYLCGLIYQIFLALSSNLDSEESLIFFLIMNP